LFLLYLVQTAKEIFPAPEFQLATVLFEAILFQNDKILRVINIHENRNVPIFIRFRSTPDEHVTSRVIRQD
jgi:hypothetical protein